MASSNFDTIFTKTKPHILEKICLSLDYQSFKNCLQINKAWKVVLTSKVIEMKAKRVFKEEILEDASMLLRASQEGNAGEVAILLSSGMVDVDFEQEEPPYGRGAYGKTPLHFAAWSGHKEVVQLLLDGGANPNKEDEEGGNPLYEAANVGHIDVVQLLLEHGSNPNNADNYQNTPLHVSSQRHHHTRNVVKLLLDNGADPNKQDVGGRTRLHIAARLGQTDVAQLLLDSGADPNVKDVWGNPPLHDAFNKGQKDLVKLLLDNGADPNLWKL